MSLASPLNLLWLATLIPVVVFYILKIRLRRVPVSTILFWRQIYDEHQPRSIWQRLRHWLSLLAQVVLILLLVGALADPFFAWETRQLRRIVLIVDNSASMNATDVSPSRLSAARDEALRVIRGMRFRDELAVVTAGGAPRVVCGFSSHGRTLSHAVDDVTSTDNPTRVNEAVELARRLLGERQDEHQREIVVLTDTANANPTGLAPVARGLLHDSNGESPTTPPNSNEEDVVQKPENHRGKPGGGKTELIVRRFGTNTGNVGITQFQVRRSLIDPLGYEILAEVTNASDEPVECRLEIDLNADIVDVVPLKLTPGQRWSQSFEKTSADGGHLTAMLDRADALAADNRAWAVLPKREMMPVTLVSEGNLFLQKVFESNPLVTLTRIDPPVWKPEAGSRQPLSPFLPSPNAGITVLHRQIPEVLPSGAVLVIDPRGSCDAWQLGEPIQNPIVQQQEKDSPLLGHVRLDNVVMPEARQLKFASDEGVKVLARSLTGDPLLATIERPGQKVLLLTVNLDEGDLPL
ncbi:MAG: VWA domain-containing protein, partial [Planctomycetaceae bacterium]|nr:VWA domain-containing protein [Planctomycetaceae bacterium]